MDFVRFKRLFLSGFYGGKMVVFMDILWVEDDDGLKGKKKEVQLFFVFWSFCCAA